MRLVKLSPLLILLPALARGSFTLRGTLQTSFVARGPAGLKIVGKSNKGVVQESDFGIVFSLPLSTLSTGIALRDKHMREKYLVVQKYPDATLKIDKAHVQRITSGLAPRGRLNAELTLHGVSKMIVVSYETSRVPGAGKAWQVLADILLDIRSFGIEVPRYLGVEVKPDIEIHVSTQIQS